MITKTVVKDYAIKKCPYLASLELEDNTLISLLKESIDNRTKYQELLNEEAEESSKEFEGPKDDFDLLEALRDYPHIKKEIMEYSEKSFSNELEKLIFNYSDNQLISNLSRRYFELRYGKDKCVRCDIDKNGEEIYDQGYLAVVTKNALQDKNIKVVFEGLIQHDDLRARFDVLIKNDDGSYDIIEVKGTNSVFEQKAKCDTIKPKYLYDLAFQYYVYSKANMNIRSVAFMFTNKDYALKKEAYPVDDSELNDLFVIENEIRLEEGYKSLKQYFDDDDYAVKKLLTVDDIIKTIRDIQKQKNIAPVAQYYCKKGPTCPFLKMCFHDSDDPNSIFRLSNWGQYGGSWTKTSDSIGAGIKKISDVDKGVYKSSNKDNGDKKNVVTQIEFAKGEIKEKYLIYLSRLKEIIEKDYLNENIKYLVFFDFESFQYPIPLVKDSTPWKQVVSQYSMHIAEKNYDITKHDFDKGVGGGITHFEYIGNPDVDKYENPSIKLYETLFDQLKKAGINPLGNDYKVIVFNKTFERTRMKDYIEDFPNGLTTFVSTFRDNVVDLLDFFTSGSIYSREFNGKGSLKVVQPELAKDPDVLNFYNGKLLFDLTYSLDYHKPNRMVANGAVCLDLYKTLLIRSHLKETHIGTKTEDLLEEAKAYCKIDTWGTVFIFDVLKNVYLGKLKLDAKYA